MLDRPEIPPSGMAADPLGEALHILRMRGAFYCRSELTEPWGLTLPALPGHLWFHVLTAGRCLLETAGAGPRALLPGDLALVPHGEGHVIRSGAGVAAPAILDLERERIGTHHEILRHGGGDAASATLICGAVRFDHPAAPGLLRVLPQIVHVQTSHSAQDRWLCSTLELMASEVSTPRPGGETLITRLADVVVILAIRTWLANDPGARTGWLGALRDRQIGGALSAIHRHPERSWSVASLAREVAMSRSAFSERFTELVGEPPMRYATHWRMHLAHAALREEGATVSSVAARFGYRSEAAFSRAFKRVTGHAPGAARRYDASENAHATPVPATLRSAATS